MADEKNTTDKTIVDPHNTENQITNPDYVEPKTPPTAASKELDLNEPDTEIIVGSTGNTAIDAVGQLLADHKVKNANTIISEFAKTGEVSIAAKADLLDKLGDSLGQMAINQLSTEAANLKTANTTARGKVLDYANEKFSPSGNGDSDKTWEQIKDYVKSPESGFTPEDRKAMTKMLAKGGLQAELAIDKIHATYMADPNTTVQADLIHGDVSTSTSFTPLTAREYSVKVTEATKKYGYDSAQVRQLQAQRTASRKQGIA